MYKYQFTSTIKDLLDAEEADTTESTGLRKSLRWIIAVFGALWLIVGLVSLGSSERDWNSIVWIILGSILLHYFFVASYKRRRLVRKGNASAVEIALEFHDDCIKIDVSGHGVFRRDWHELYRIVDAPRGVLLHFSDGVVNWLPNRVFDGKAQRTAFIKYLRNREGQ